MRTWKEMKARIAELEKQNREFSALAVESRDLWVKAQAQIHETREKLDAALRVAAMWEQARATEKKVLGLLEAMEPPAYLQNFMRLKVAISLLGGEAFDLVGYLSQNCIPAGIQQPTGTLPAKEPRYALWMTNLGDKKINVIKEIRALTGLGLKEAKDMSEAFLPVLIKDGMSEMEARRAKGLFEAAGAIAEIR